MADDPNNLVLSLLREMRDENREFREEMRTFRQETNERLDAVEQQMTGMGGVIYSIYGKVMDHDERIADLEAKMAEPAE